MKKRILLCPGLDNSGELHWQSIWQKRQLFTNAIVERVEHSSWDNPVFETWMKELETCLDERPTILVAHSLGCLNVTHLSQDKLKFPSNILGALLVAPPNVERPDLPARIKGFKNPTKPLWFPSILAASSNDPYGDIDFSEDFAKKVGSRFINLGDLGHVNVESNLKEWQFGIDMMEELLSL